MNEDIPIRGENMLILILSKTTSTYLIYATILLDTISFEWYTLTKLDITFCSHQI